MRRGEIRVVAVVAAALLPRAVLALLSAGAAVGQEARPVAGVHAKITTIAMPKELKKEIKSVDVLQAVREGAVGCGKKCFFIDSESQQVRLVFPKPFPEFWNPPGQRDK